MAEHSPFVLDTYSGQRLDLDAPSPRDIQVRDICAALSKVCRFGAQARRFHSVAQHAVLVMRFTAEDLDRPDLGLWALHHDSHEAYTCDIPRPLKLKLRQSGDTAYDEVCESLDVVIAEAIGAERPPKKSAEAKVIDRADDMALIVEARSLLANADAGISTKTPFTSEESSGLPALGKSLVSEEAEAEFWAAHTRAVELASTPDPERVVSTGAGNIKQEKRL